MIGGLFRQLARLAAQLPDLPRLLVYQRTLWVLRRSLLGHAERVRLGERVRLDGRFYYPRGLELRVGDRVRIKRDVRLGWEPDHAPSAAVEIGDRTEVLAHARLDGTGGIRIGRGTHIGRACAIYTHRHAVGRRDVPVLEAPIEIAPVRIGDDVMIYSDVVILPGVSIGDGAVVGVRAVVTNDVEPYDIVAGVPAQRIGQRD